MTFFISGNVPSLKNSKQIIKCGNRPMLIPSKTHRRWAESTAREFLEQRDAWLKAIQYLERPLPIAFRFIRDSRRRFDLDNALSTIQDAMVSSGWLDDDSADEVLPVLMPYEYDKNAPGVEIRIVMDYSQYLAKLDE